MAPTNFPAQSGADAKAAAAMELGFLASMWRLITGSIFANAQ